MTDTEKDADQKKTIRFYGAFGATIVFSLIPTILAAIVTLFLFIGVMISAYVMRSGAEDGSLTENHMTYVIRTIWISGLWALITITAGSFYMLAHIDQNALLPCAEKLLGIGVGGDPNMMMALLQPCIDNFIAVNKQILITSCAIVAGPVLIYLIARYVRGLSRALGGYRVANVKGWF